MRAKPTGEWTVDGDFINLGNGSLGTSLQAIADAHNAALDAERETSRKWEDNANLWCNKAKNRLAAEREKTDYDETREQRDKWQQEALKLREQQQVLIDALKPFAPLASEITNNRKQLGVLTQEDFIRAAAALTKVEQAAALNGNEHETPEYQEFLSECAKHCRCSMTICESVLAGGPCEERIEPDDLDDNLP